VKSRLHRGRTALAAHLTETEEPSVGGNAGSAWDHDIGDGDTLIVMTRSTDRRNDVRKEWRWDGAHFRRSN
jgi:hypothetical protein